MVRVRTGIVRHRRHKKIKELAKGYWMTRKTLIGKATEAVLHAGEYAFAGRRMRKRQFRKLWIVRLNAALRERNTTYSKFIRQLSVANIQLDRKILAKFATEQPKVLDSIVEHVSKK